MKVTTINLRNLPDELVRKAKTEAIRRGLSLKGFVVEAIKVRCGEPSGEVGKGMPKPHTAKTERGGSVEGILTREAGMGVDVEVPATPPAYSRPAHDPKECRLHGCLMCKMAKG